MASVTETYRERLIPLASESLSCPGESGVNFFNEGLTFSFVGTVLFFCYSECCLLFSGIFVSETLPLWKYIWTQPKEVLRCLFFFLTRSEETAAHHKFWCKVLHNENRRDGREGVVFLTWSLFFWMSVSVGSRDGANRHVMTMNSTVMEQQERENFPKEGLFVFVWTQLFSARGFLFLSWCGGVLIMKINLL